MCPQKSIAGLALVPATNCVEDALCAIDADVRYSTICVRFTSGSGNSVRVEWEFARSSESVFMPELRDSAFRLSGHWPQRMERMNVSVIERKVGCDAATSAVKTVRRAVPFLSSNQRCRMPRWPRLDLGLIYRHYAGKVERDSVKNKGIGRGGQRLSS